ncbi:MAG: hypothetical protein JRI99_04485 [Deltaproteobacteria bacterium]|nr:hypothetical protein [Deltaproteobacteria bacterium]
MTSAIIPTPGDEEAQEFETAESDEKLEIAGEDEFLKDIDEIEQPEATEKPVLSEEIDLSDVEKMLETGLEEEAVTGGGCNRVRGNRDRFVRPGPGSRDRRNGNA